jgi:(p)ppGpp synthase/HD superfamily hydrolase
MKPTLEDTLIFAAQKHRGQTDKAGQPYIFHPIRVMQNLGAQASDEEKMAALLHDVVEDCGVSLGHLRHLGYPEAVVVAVDHLTKEEGERDYQLAIERAACNPIARRVKIADLTDNMNLNRIAQPGDKDFERIEKYGRAKAFLESL